MAVVVASKLSKSFGPLVAVNDLDLAIEEGRSSACSGRTDRARPPSCV